MSGGAGDGTGTLEKALDVLEAVGASPEGLSQGEITGRLALPRTTVYRLVATLVARGLLRRDPLRKVYCLGFRCFEMARQAYAMPDLVAASAAELRALRDLTGETSYLAALDGMEVISLERYDGAHSQRSAAALGQRKPVHCTSQGKAILSAMEPAARDAMVRDLALKAMTPLTITDRRRLQAELKITAARGWSIDDEEIVLGERCVGAPVVDPQGKVRGAISVAGPAWRLTRERVELLGPEVAEAGRRIGAQLQSAAVPSSDSTVQAVPGPWAFHGGFPRWCARTRRLYWADALAPALRVFDGQADGQLCETDTPIVGLILRADDLLVAHEAGALRVTPAGLSAPITAWPGGKLLAIAAGPQDSVWAAFESADGGCAIGLIEPGGHFDGQWRLDERVRALCWDPRQQQLCAAAPSSGAIMLLRPGAAAVLRLGTIPKGSGRLGGLATDAAGGVWAALSDGWSVLRISPDGILDRVIGLPVPCPTDVAVGGANGDQLFITTARQPVALDTLGKAPLSGRLLVTSI
jgi:IclR family acetate operon transcriptional repressor